MPIEMQQAIDQLRDHSSVKRRSAAKRLRAIADPSAGPALLKALQAEVTDSRTWETQYQMVMALGACQHAPAVAFLERLADEQTDYTMVGVALGDALVRIEWATRHSVTVVDTYLQSGARSLADGAFRAFAVLRIVPDADHVGRVLDFVERLDLDDPLRFWIATAAAGWTGPRVEAFLRTCLASPRSDTAEAATNSLAGTYTNHRIL